MAGLAGTKDEDEDLTQLLKEEEAQISSKILALRRDVRTQKTQLINAEVCDGLLFLHEVFSLPQLIKALIPTDPLDSSNVLLEVVSGRTTGGMKESKTLNLFL